MSAGTASAQVDVSPQAADGTPNMDDLVIDHLTKTFAAQMAVDDVSLSAAPGQCVTLLGPSGCGKTTTLRCVAGLEEPDSGRIVLGDRVLWEPSGRQVSPEDREMGMVFQSYALWPHLTVYDNVAYPLSVRKVSRQETEERVHEAVATVGMAGREGRYPAQLSGGQQQRVALARSIVARPRVLLFDEPLSNLDRALRDEMRIELRRIITQLGITSLYVTHDQAEAFAIADVVVVMNAGRLEQQGPPREIFHNPRSEFVAHFLGGDTTLTGRVTATHAASSEITLDDTDSVIQVDKALPVGSSVVAGMHPDCVRLAPEPVIANGAPGRLGVLPVEVVEMAFLGGIVEFIAQCGPHRLKGRLRTADVDDVLGPAGFQAGDELHLYLDPTNVIAFET